MYGGWKSPVFLCHLGRSFNVVVQVLRGGGQAGISVQGQWQTTSSPWKPSQHTHTSQSIINKTSLQRSNNQHQHHGPHGPINQQWRPPRYDGNCGACGWYGHKETHCDHLAIWANLQRYLKMATPATLQQAESEWLEKNKRFLGGSTLTPSKVAANFIAAHNVDINHIFTTLDWGSWSEETGFTLLDDSE